MRVAAVVMTGISEEEMVNEEVVVATIVTKMTGESKMQIKHMVKSLEEIADEVVVSAVVEEVIAVAVEATDEAIALVVGLTSQVITEVGTVMTTNEKNWTQTKITHLRIHFQQKMATIQVKVRTILPKFQNTVMFFFYVSRASFFL